MNANIEKLHAIGQRVWLDNISRELLDSGTLARYIADFSVKGLTSNPTIFEHAISHSDVYDDAIATSAALGASDESIFFDLALDDLKRAADLFRPTFDASGGVDGWVSLEVSPLLAHDATNTINAARELHARHRVAHQCRTRPEYRVSGIVIRQPLGYRSEGTNSITVSQSSGYRHRHAYLRCVSAIAGVSARA